MAHSGELSDKSIRVLRLLAEGFDCDHIIGAEADLTREDIRHAATEALLCDISRPGYHERLAAIKAKHLRAYEPWTDEEDDEVRAMCADGEHVSAIAEHLGRQPSAVRSRLRKLGLKS